MLRHLVGEVKRVEGGFCTSIVMKRRHVQEPDRILGLCSGQPHPVSYDVARADLLRILGPAASGVGHEWKVERKIALVGTVKQTGTWWPVLITAEIVIGESEFKKFLVFRDEKCLGRNAARREMNKIIDGN